MLYIIFYDHKSLTEIQSNSIATNLGYHSKTFQIGLTGLAGPNAVKLFSPTENSNVAKQENQVAYVCPPDISLLQLFGEKTG